MIRAELNEDSRNATKGAAKTSHSRAISDAEKAATHVKVVVLDTGFQAPKGLYENYVALGKVSAIESENFTDNDGHMHGTTVARILINITPVADVHVARVFEKGEDLDNPKAATQVYRRIAEAIDRATKKWKVDLIVMSFGFGQPVEQVRKAMAEASKSAKLPLFLVTTRNVGANEDVAWPARGTIGGVFGISLTDGDGCGSSFNPRDYHSSTHWERRL
ncbi:hypothetical protein BKA61DRAFT_637264 [Leptodontidium sp. MPI-SDFR-AT-0119]|nr:hypothetical protein BKA61DRAFT_637264 [Leptodontidium sp. MPI-SDFR-AT-0119]